MNNIKSPNQLALAILSIIICALSVNLYILANNIIFPEKKIQYISGYLNRFEPLREILPRSGAVGYLDGMADDEIATPRNKYLLDESLPTLQLYLAQYSLAPIILVRSLDYRFVVGNYRNPKPDFETYRQMGLIPLRNFGNGVVLFRQESR
jgi:hypothetical protein